MTFQTSAPAIGSSRARAERVEIPTEPIPDQTWCRSQRTNWIWEEAMYRIWFTHYNYSHTRSGNFRMIINTTGTGAQAGYYG